MGDRINITSDDNTDYILSNEQDLIIEEEYREIENTDNYYSNVEGDVPAPSYIYNRQNDNLKLSNSIELENTNRYSYKGTKKNL